MWSSLFNQLITTVSAITFDGYGGKTKTTLYEDMKCRWEEKFTRVLNKEGVEVTSGVECWIPVEHESDTVDIDVDYIFTYLGTDYVIIAYNTAVDINGVNQYIKVYLK